MPIYELDLGEEPTQEASGEGPDIVQDFLRPLANIGARGLQSLFTVPFDIADLGYKLGAVGLKKAANLFGADVDVPSEVKVKAPDIAGAIAPYIQDEALRERLTSEGQRAQEFQDEGYRLPTSQVVEETVTKPAIESVFGEGAAEPQSRLESRASEFVSDVAALFSPFGIIGGLPFKRALQLAGMGNLASFLTEEAGGGEGAQAGAKIGTMLATSFLGQGGTRYFSNRAQDLYNEAKGSVSPETLTKGRALKNDLFKIERSLARRNFPKKDIVTKNIDTIINNINEGNSIRIHDVIDARQDINAWLRDSSLAGKGASSARKSLGDVSQVLNKTLDAAGKEWPHFARQSLAEADDLYKAMKGSNMLSNALSKISFKSPYMNMLATGAGGYLTYKAFKNYPGISKAVGGIGSLLAFGKLLNNHPSLRKATIELLKSTGKDPLPVIAKKAKHLDSLLEKKAPPIGSGIYELDL